MNPVLDDVLSRIVSWRLSYQESSQDQDDQYFEKEKSEYLKLCRRILKTEGRVLKEEDLANFLEEIFDKAKKRAMDESEEIYRELFHKC